MRYCCRRGPEGEGLAAGLLRNFDEADIIARRRHEEEAEQRAMSESEEESDEEGREELGSEERVDGGREGASGGAWGGGAAAPAAAPAAAATMPPVGAAAAAAPQSAVEQDWYDEGWGAGNEGMQPAAALPEPLADRRRRQLVVEMETRFLTGLDGEFVDYRRMDADETLDDVWLDQAGRDAEDRYFDED